MPETPDAAEEVRTPEAKDTLDPAAAYAAEVAAVPAELRHLIGDAELRTRLGGTRGKLADLVQTEARWRTSQMATENWGE